MKKQPEGWEKTKHPSGCFLQEAEELVLSPRTVHTHLSSIYSKLGITSRSAATRYAIEHHLA